MIKILNEIEGTDLIRIENNHKISIVKKEKLEINKKTLCEFNFDKDSQACKDCPNLEYCSLEARRK